MRLPRRQSWNLPSLTSLPPGKRFTGLNGERQGRNSREFLPCLSAGQAFHWFERGKARKEFARILKPDGWVVLIWNERKLDSTPFLREYENLLLQYGTDYERIRHENVTGEIAQFFAPGIFRLKNFENAQHFDFEALMGRTRSASYTPEPGSPNFEPMFAKLEQIFDANKRAGMVSFEYYTRVYYGRLANFT